MQGRRQESGGGEQGFILLGLIVAIFIILLVLGVAAPRMARSLQRDREVESMHRANQYVRGIQMYYKKLGRYPGSIEQMEKANNQRFLRQKYVDPLTGKADWRLIHVGEAKTTVKGFFGQPLSGIASSGLGSAQGMVSPGIGGAPGAGGTSFGSRSGSSFGSSSGSSAGLGGSGLGSSGSSFGGASFGSGSSSPGTGGLGASPSPGSGIGGAPGSTGSTGSSGIGSQSATSFTGGGAPFVGVGSAAGGEAIVVVNEQTTHPTWEFLYDPRVEAMRAKTSIFGGGVATAGTGGLGSASSGFGGGTRSTGTTGPSGTTPSSFGSPSSFGTPSSGSPPSTPPANPPQ